MSRIAILNIILGGIAASLVTILVVLETNEDPPAPTTTTTSTTTTTTTILPTTSTSTTVPPPSTTTSSTAPSTVPPSTEAPDDRFFVGILVVNGTTAGERVQPAVDRLRSAGYGQVRGTGGAVVTQETVIYAIDESFRAEAEVVAADLGYEPGEIPVELFEDAPPVSGVLEARVIVYLGPEPLPEL